MERASGRAGREPRGGGRGARAAGAGAGMSLAVTGARLDGEVVGLRVEGGSIVALGPGVDSTPGDEVIDAGGMALVPGLVNGHTHAAMTLFRGHGGDLPLMRWLEEVIWPVEARLDAEDVYWGLAAGLRGDDPNRHGALLGHVLACRRHCPRGRGRRASGHDRRAADRRRRRGRGGTSSARARSAASRRSARAARADRAGARPARRLHGLASRRCDGSRRRPQERELPVHIHLSETEDEVARCVEAHGAPPGRVPGPARAAGAADAACPRGLAGRGGDRADRCTGRHGGHQSSRQPEARGGSRLPLPRGARSRRPGRPRHRWAGIERLARPVRRHEDLCAAPQAPGGRSRRGERRRGVGDRHRPSLDPAAGRQPRRGRAGRLPAAARGLAPS